MSGYIGAIPTPQATQSRDVYTATSNQTTFTTQGYTPGFVSVYLNGVHLARADFTATNGSDVVLASGATVNDTVEIVSFGTFQSADALPLTGGSITGNVAFGDSNKILMGASSDLSLYHDGSNSYLQDLGTGYLVISGNGPGVRINSDTAEVMADFTPNGAATLYHNNAAKLATTATGATITGAVKPTTYQETYVANSTGSTTTLDLATGTSFSVTLSENTTFAFSNPPTSGTAYSFTLFITQPASAKTIAWPGSVDWAGGSAPDAPGNNEVNGYGFFTRDGGTTYYGFLGGAALG